MAIPESQLETWARQGSITQSATTYATVRGVLDASETPYASKDGKVFLQGSYGNDTNIYAESDVDIVMQIDGVFQHELIRIRDDQKLAFHRAMSNETYTYDALRNDVIAVLRGSFGSSVQPGRKAIVVAASGGRRKADVVAAMKFRRYSSFNSLSDQSYAEGICFYTTDGQRIINYPKQHSANLTTKQKATRDWFKPMVRIVKNMRRRMVESGRLGADVAPSYFIEGLLYNVPAEKFGGTFEDSFVNAFNWILTADRSKFVCANEQYYLVRDGSAETWSAGKCELFLSELAKYWRDGG